MVERDIIYVKDGTKIVGRGIVTAPYCYDRHCKIACPDDHELSNPFAHQVGVLWDRDFEPVEIKLGVEPNTILKLSERQQRRLEAAIRRKRKPADDSGDHGSEKRVATRNATAARIRARDAKANRRAEEGFGETDQREATEKKPLTGNAAWRAKHLAAGNCVWCGRPRKKHPSLCEECHRKNVKRGRETRRLAKLGRQLEAERKVSQQQNRRPIPTGG